ncbi:hypothetical protein R6Q57_016360 [Mikania cordata]
MAFSFNITPHVVATTVEFLSTFVYRPQAPDFHPQPGQPQPAEISLRLCGDSYDLSLREFVMVTGLYTEAQNHMLIYTTAIHTADDAVFSAWWPQISDEPFVRRAWVTRIRDPLIRYLHQCIASSITGRGMIQEWRDGRSTGVYVTRIALFNELIDIESTDMQVVHPIHLYRRAVHGLCIVQKFPHLGLRFALEKGFIW